jgi:acid stress-induced BolA-like protein IbaG/YrbA
MASPKEVEAMIKQGLPDAIVQIFDARGTGDHYEVVVVSEKFVGKSRVQQHQIVYGSVQSAMASGEIHALQLDTKTPEEWQAVKSA